MKRLGLRLLLGAGFIGALGCLEDRARIDVPTVTVTAADTVIDGARWVSGTLHAADGSGLLLVRVEADSPVRSASQRFDLGEDPSFDGGFLLPLGDSATVGMQVKIEATAFDNQNFTAVADTTITIRATP